MFRNKLPPERRDWSGIVFNGLPPGSGVLFEEVTLDKSVGPECVALVVESEPDELLRRPELTFNLKTGIADTSYGPVLFLIWWIPSARDRRPIAFYEQVMNPLNPKTSMILHRLADQTHLHMLVLDSKGQVQNLFEYKNTFDFDKLLEAVARPRAVRPESDDFRLARKAYEQEYEMEDIVAGRYD